MKIALDYDGTVTEDVQLWTWFVSAVKHRGHDIRVVTFRSGDELTQDLFDFAEVCGIEIIFTGRVLKQKFCKEQMNWEPDVWIDDSPALIGHDDGVWEKEKLDAWKESLSNRITSEQLDSHNRKLFTEKLD